MAGTIKIGKWDISPQSGSAGSTSVGHKLTERHTGRNKYQKMVRASISNAAANAEAIEILEIAGQAPFLTLNTTQIDIAYNVTTAVINGSSNAEKFRISSSGKTASLVSNTGYTVSGSVGTFTAGFGEQASGSIAIKVQFAANNSQASVTIPVKIEYYNGSTWETAGTYNIIQSSADAGVTFNIDPRSLSIFAKGGETKTVTIESSIAYAIELSGDIETDWVVLSRNSGVAGTATLDITAAKQAVGAAQRQLTINFRNNVTNSVITTLNVVQEAGEDFAISWANDTLTFTNDDVNTIKTNTLTANSDWYIEEKLN
ncbi:MAG: hypothetical protein J6U48_04955 [Alistipes sp.]|nr:hypothetical protein [Alistipes sp.]